VRPQALARAPRGPPEGSPPRRALDARLARREVVLPAEGIAAARTAVAAITARAATDPSRARRSSRWRAAIGSGRR
jgi:hypothetical protein